MFNYLNPIKADRIKDAIKIILKDYPENLFVTYSIEHIYHCDAMEFRIYIKQEDGQPKVVLAFSVSEFYKYISIEHELVARLSLFAREHSVEIFDKIIQKLKKEYIIFVTTNENMPINIREYYEENFVNILHFYNPNENHYIDFYASEIPQESFNKSSISVSRKTVDNIVDILSYYYLFDYKSKRHTNYDLGDAPDDLSIQMDLFPNCCGAKCIYIYGKEDYAGLAEYIASYSDAFETGALMFFVNNKYYKTVACS